jgi:hypothetical protein
MNFGHGWGVQYLVKKTAWWESKTGYLQLQVLGQKPIYSIDSTTNKWNRYAFVEPPESRNPNYGKGNGK